MLILEYYSIIKRNKIHFIKHKYKIAILYLLSIISNILGLIPIYLFGDSVNYIVNGNIHQVKYIVFKMAILFIINMILSYAETYLSIVIDNKIVIDIKNSVFERIIDTNVLSYETMNEGEYISRIEGDASSISNFIVNDVMKYFLYLIDIIVSLYFAFKLSISLSVISLLILPINIILMRIFGKFIDKKTRIGKSYNDSYYSFLQEVLISFREIKCMNISQYIKDIYLTNLTKVVKNNYKLRNIQAISNIFSMIFTSIFDWATIILGAILIIGNKLTIGAYVAFNNFISRFIVAIQQLSNCNYTLKNAKVASERLEELLKLPPENIIKTIDDFKISSGKIEVVNLSFNFNNLSSQVLNGIDFSVNSNSLHAIVGNSGCGKSTLLNLISGLYRIQEGQIYIDNNDITDINTEWLRENVSYIQQEQYIFNGTIRDNLLFGKSGITDERLDEICKVVNLYDFINSLYHKYDTYMGNGGVKLSGGQRQRLSIARALLKDCKILIFDEITSDLDGKSEIAIMKILNKLKYKKTIIIVTHRITTLMYADKINVIDKGKVVSTGSHEDLIKKCEVYKSLYKEQLEKCALYK